MNFNMKRKLKQLKRLKILHYLLIGLCTINEIQKLKLYESAENSIKNDTNEVLNGRRKIKRSCGVRKCNRDRKRNGFFTMTFCKVRDMDHEQFFVYTRMTPEIYQQLLNVLKPHLTKKSIREPVMPECRLAVTLMYLSQGTPFRLLADSFKLGKETVRSIVLETTEVLRNILFHENVIVPNAEKCSQITEDFWNLYEMPHCLGAIAGKLIAIKFPSVNCPSYDSRHSSMVLFAACDTRYRFTYVDVGAYGNQDLFEASEIGNQIINNELPIPPPSYLPNSEIEMPYFLIGDATMPLAQNIMRPYQGEVSNERAEFNTKLLRIHQLIENSLGVLAARWRVLLTTLCTYPDHAKTVVLSCIALHNYIMFNDKTSTYIPTNYVDRVDETGKVQEGLWRSEFKSDDLPSIEPSENINIYGGKPSSDKRNSLCNFITNTFATIETLVMGEDELDFKATEVALMD